MKALKIAGVGALALAASVVGFYEGKRNNAYQDPVGIPTICYGHTADVQMGQTRTDEECQDLLQSDLGDAFDTVDRLVETPLSEPRRAALASFVYNVGAEAFARSTLLRRLNAGDPNACEELDRWVYAGGRQLKGLVRRRATERELCEWSGE